MEEAKLMVGHKIRAIREMQKVSQESLATHIDLPQNSISMIESDQMSLTFNEVCEIADALNVDVNTLINYDKPERKDAKLMVGPKVRAIRELQEVSQDFLAKQVGISQTSMSMIENGQMPLSFDKVCEIAGILNVDVNTIINYDKSVIFNTCTQSGYINTNYINSPEKMEGLYEKLLAEKDEQIKLLKDKIDQLNS